MNRDSIDESDYDKPQDEFPRARHLPDTARRDTIYENATVSQSFLLLGFAIDRFVS